MERVVPSSGLNINGHYLPPGTIVSVPHYCVHRDTTTYGPNAEDFQPQRWLEADTQTLDRMDQSFMTVSTYSAAFVYVRRC
jgi:cytochrome P450